MAARKAKKKRTLLKYAPVIAGTSAQRVAACVSTAALPSVS